ncbi:hypothetical protein GGI21_005211, partial [Coemansia aciculifera]
MRRTFGAERSLSLFGARAQPTQVRGFSYTTLVDPDFVDGVHLYQADDLVCPESLRPANPSHSQGHEYSSSSNQTLGGQRRQISKTWSSVTTLDGGRHAIADEDIPRIEGRARQLQRKARRKIVTALELARDGWETFWLGISQVKRRRFPSMEQNSEVNTLMASLNYLIQRGDEDEAPPLSQLQRLEASLQIMDGRLSENSRMVDEALSSIKQLTDVLVCQGQLLTKMHDRQGACARDLDQITTEIRQARAETQSQMQLIARAQAYTTS